MPLIRRPGLDGWDAARYRGCASIRTMFATLLGPLPRPPLPEDAAPEAVLDAILSLQVEHGLEPVTDAGWPMPAGPRRPGDHVDPIAAWRSTAARADRLVKAVVVGPYSAGTPAVAVRRQLLDLAAAGCRWIEVHEPATVSIGGDEAARARFADLHHNLTDDLDGVHLSLAIVGGSAHAAGIGTILAGSYASLALDLIDGPDNWHLAVAAPGDRGIVAGVVGAAPGADDSPENPAVGRRVRRVDRWPGRLAGGAGDGRILCAAALGRGSDEDPPAGRRGSPRHGATRGEAGSTRSAGDRRALRGDGPVLATTAPPGSLTCGNGLRPLTGAGSRCLTRSPPLADPRQGTPSPIDPDFRIDVSSQSGERWSTNVSKRWPCCRQLSVVLSLPCWRSS